MNYEAVIKVRVRIKDVKNRKDAMAIARQMIRELNVLEFWGKGIASTFGAKLLQCHKKGVR